MNNELALSEVMTLGEALAESKYFSDAKQASQAIVKVLAGQELGIGPVAAMSGIYIVQGNVTLSGNVMASLVKASPKYDYKIIDHNNQTCVIEFFESNESIGVSEFTMEDAKQAGLQNKDNWKAYPKNMLFNRALSNGAKWFCPDLFNGQSVYTPDEIEPEPVEDLIIENPVTGAILEGVATEPNPGLSLDTGRQKWIESIMASENFPSKGGPKEKIDFINAELQTRELDIAPITVPEILGNGG